MSPAVKAFVAVDAPLFALTHVRVIDGTGAAVREDQTIIVSGGKIQTIGDSSLTPVPAGISINLTYPEACAESLKNIS